MLLCGFIYIEKAYCLPSLQGEAICLVSNPFLKGSPSETAHAQAALRTALEQVLEVGVSIIAAGVAVPVAEVIGVTAAASACR